LPKLELKTAQIEKNCECAKKKMRKTGPMVDAGKTVRQVFKYGVMR